jgi:hypothetical protein
MLLSLWSVCRRCENENCPSSGTSVATIVLGFTSSWTQAIIDALVNFCLELCVPVQNYLWGNNNNKLFYIFFYNLGYIVCAFSKHVWIQKKYCKNNICTGLLRSIKLMTLSFAFCLNKHRGMLLTPTTNSLRVGGILHLQGGIISLQLLRSTHNIRHLFSKNNNEYIIYEIFSEYAKNFL